MALILVSGALANKPHNGGEAWVRLSWILGLRKLGCRVIFIEELAANNCIDSSGKRTSFEESTNLKYFQQVAAEFGLSGLATLICPEENKSLGMTWAELLDIATAADLLVNISGHLTLEPLKCAPRRRAYIDIDPGFTQIWHAQANAGARLAGHDFYFTIGENIGSAECRIPTNGIPWRPIRQPVVLEEWPVSPAPDPCRFTTVASWRGPFGPLEHQGTMLGLKVHEFRKVVSLPARSAHTFEIALDIHANDAADRRLLQDHGWSIDDPQKAAGTPHAFRRFVQESGAEFSVAQGVYVQTNSGWFSDRTARYLASGKPALIQDTGFGRTYPIGEGLVPFRTLDEAIIGVERITSDYRGHCQAARAIAERFFDSDKVLGRLLEETVVAV